MYEGGREMHSEGGRWYGGGERGEESYYGGADGRILIPRYYRPTARYYGNGYTVSYRFIPVFRTDSPRSGSVGESSNFPTASTHMTVAQYESFGNNLARVTQRDEHSGSTRTAVTSIVRKKPAGRAAKKDKGVPDVSPGEMPAITPAAPAPETSAPAPTPGAPAAPAPAPAPDASAPSAAPASGGPAPAKP